MLKRLAMAAMKDSFLAEPGSHCPLATELLRLLVPFCSFEKLDMSEALLPRRDRICTARVCVCGMQSRSSVLVCILLEALHSERPY